MGTNYYLQKDACPHCGRAADEIHIGKSSGGWVFALHVYPDIGIRDLADWLPLFEMNPMRDEYGTAIDATTMRTIITERGRGAAKPVMYDSWTHFHESNHSEPGPNNLVRSRIDGSHCIGHGEGTWDLFIGEFS